MKVVKDVPAAVVLAVAAVMVFTVAVRFFSDYLIARSFEWEGYRRTPEGWVHGCPHPRYPDSRRPRAGAMPSRAAYGIIDPKGALRYDIIAPKGALVRRYECLP